jgi:hypothetical protein
MSSTVQVDWSTQNAILGADPAATLYQDVSQWFDKVKKFQREEDERMIDKDPTPKDLKIHKELVLRLIDDGEHLLKLIQRRGRVGKDPHYITTGAVDSTVEMLRASYRGWHEPMPKEERDRILKAVFGDVT